MNKRLKKFFITIITIFISISILLGIVWLVVPIRRSDNAIRKYILKKIELGTNYTDVINYINNENWEIRSENSYGMSFNEITGEIHSIFKDDEKKSEIKILGKKQYMFILANIMFH